LFDDMLHVKDRFSYLLNGSILAFVVYFFVVVLSANLCLVSVVPSHFSYLASSFLQGKPYFQKMPGSWVDATPYNGNYYWPAGPFSAVLLLPFVYLSNLFNLFFHQGFLQPFLVFGVFFLCYKIAQKLKYRKNDSLFLAFLFCFSTVFVNVALWPEAWGFSQVVTTLLLFLAIFSYLNKHSYLFIGIFIGLIVVTRITAAISLVFFLLAIVGGKSKLGSKLKSSALLLMPVLVFLILAGFYNFIRFGSFVEQGYSKQILTHPSLEKARDYGMINLVHLPGNLYYFLLSGPLPIFKDNLSHVLKFPFVKANPWGMSIFITSPIFFYLFFLSYKDKLSKILITTIIIIAVPIFLYYGIGARQMGYRYSLDFLPFLYLLLIRNYKSKFKELNNIFKLIVLSSSVINFYLFLTAFSLA
jgi:hypothetical protein